MRPRFAAPLAAVVLCSTPAAADTLSALRSDEMVERAHVVNVALGRGHARLTVRRTVYNGGARHDQATFHLELPHAAVATGLRTQGMADGVPRWFAASLIEAEAAAAKYKELTGIGGYYPKDPALLSWRHPGELALQVFPVGPREEKTVEYTLLVPTTYADGRDRVQLHAMGTDARRAEITVEPADASDRVFIADRPVSAGARVPAMPDDGIDLSLARGGARRIDGALASVPFGKGRVLLRQRIEAAARLSEVPRGARVVVMLDASRSLDAADAAAEVAAARAYLAHFADAEVETLLFDRRVTGLHGGFVPVKDALAALEKLTISRRNGSHLDDAFARATALFARAPARAPRRLVVLTDARTRASLGADRLRALAAATGAVVHIGVVGAGSPAVERQDGHRWEKVARATGGLVWSAGASASADDAPAMRAAYEEWARPRRIDHLRVRLPGLAGGAFGYPDHLDEGQGYEDLRIVGARVGFVKIEGELWSKPVTATLVPAEEEARLAAALATAKLASELTEPEMMVLAKVGHAVTPVTSLLAVEPGVRPSTEGIEWGNMWGTEIGDSFGAAGLGLSGIGEGGGGGPKLDLRIMLRDTLAPSWKACGGGGRRARLRIETTFAEIVDVDRHVVDGDRDGKLARCLEEAVWSLDLGDLYRLPEASYSIEL